MLAIQCGASAVGLVSAMPSGPGVISEEQIANIAVKKDADIDLTDMPEVLDWSKAEIGKFYRPTKKPVTIRLDTDIIAWLKSYGRGYQTKTNMLLRHAMKSSVRAKTEKLEK